jgi:hypothetical protein
MALKDAIAKKRQQETETGIRHNPEIDAKIDAFIKENPDIHTKISAYTHEELVRKRMYDIMRTNEQRQGYRGEVRKYAEENPTIKQEVERRMNRIPEAQREGAFTRIARGVIATVGMRQGQTAGAGNPY